MKQKPTGKLDENQIRFIENRVREIGHVDEVDRIYNKTDTVSAYARKFARIIFGKKGDKL